jgi:hypothetical protein
VLRRKDYQLPTLSVSLRILRRKAAVRDKNGHIDGVRYDELAPMLLNEVQQQQRVNATQAAKIASLEQQLAGIQAALVKLQPKEELVAQR